VREIDPRRTSIRNLVKHIVAEKLQNVAVRGLPPRGIGAVGDGLELALHWLQGRYSKAAWDTP
jgi:hypothetical protein